MTVQQASTSLQPSYTKQKHSGKESIVRKRWSSKWTFILATTGATVGLGNIWKFPYIAGSAVWLLGFLSLFSFNLWSDYQLFGLGVLRPLTISRRTLCCP